MSNPNENESVGFSIPKIKENKEDIQDAYCSSPDGSLVAIADGASTSLFAGEWAKFLVEHFCTDNQDSLESICQRWQEWLKTPQEKWRQYSIQIKTDPKIPWYVKGSSSKAVGSSTFVGLKIHPPNEAGKKIWEAIAVGDSCLFHIKAASGEIIPFPISKSKDFKTVTECCHSLPECKSYPPQYRTNFYDNRDIFILATDALAEWILKESETQTNRWEKLIDVATQEEFAEFIQQIRHDRLIKNDDTTLCLAKVLAQPLATSPAIKQQANTPSSSTIPWEPNSLLFQSDLEKTTELAQGKGQGPELPKIPKKEPESVNLSTENQPSRTVSTNEQSPNSSIQDEKGTASTLTETATDPQIQPSVFFLMYKYLQNCKLTPIQFLGGVLLLIVIVSFVSYIIYNKNQPATSLTTPSPFTESTPSVNPINNNNSGAEVPIYLADSNSDQPIGYLFKKLKNPDSFEVWVWTPKSYISGGTDGKYTLTIPPDHQLSILLADNPNPQLLPESFFGYLFPGKYSAFEPKELQGNPTQSKNQKWIKVKVKLK